MTCTQGWRGRDALLQQVSEIFNITRRSPDKPLGKFIYIQHPHTCETLNLDSEISEEVLWVVKVDPPEDTSSLEPVVNLLPSVLGPVAWYFLESQRDDARSGTSF